MGVQVVLVVAPHSVAVAVVLVIFLVIYLVAEEDLLSQIIAAQTCVMI
jgi:hypothetical protein